jgi:hypothetical protein
VAFTYGADPANSDRDAVRLLIGDTDSADQLLQDSEVDYFLGLFGTSGSARVRPAAIRSCDAIAAKFARQVDTTNQGLSVGASKRMEHYQALASELRAQQGTEATVFLGGSSYSEAQTLDQNSDLIPPAFRRGQDDYNRPEDYDPVRWGY